MKLLHHFLKVLHRKKGSPTVEYVMIIVAGALLASILVNVANSETVKEELQQAIACKFSTIMVDENGNPACKDPNIVKEKPNTSLSESNSHIVLKPVSKPLSKPDSKPKNEEKGFFDQLGDGLSSTWNGFKKDVKEFVEDPWGKTKEAAGDVWEGTKEVASDTWEWTKEHKEEIAAGLTVAAGVGLLFVPGAQAFGAGILIGAAVGGGISAVQGNDFKTIMADTAIGGLAGAVGGGVTGGVIRGVGRYIGRRATQLLGNSVGASAGSLADDSLRGKKFNWKNAAVAGVLAFGITHGVQVAKTAAPVFGITPKAQKATNQVDDIIGKRTGVSTYKGVKAPTFYGKTNGKRYATSTETGKEIKLKMGHMAGKTHPKTNIRYDENGFPEFNSDFDTYLPEDTLLSSREVHFNRCNKAIAETIEKDPEFAKKFTQDEIDQFKKGLTPKRFTWHHHQEVGKMQLVDYEIHRKTGHTGGYKIWGKDQYD